VTDYSELRALALNAARNHSRKSTTCNCQVCRLGRMTIMALDDLATLQSFYQATVRLEVELGRPETVDIERVLGITPPVLTNFWATFDAVHTEQRV